MCDFPGCINDSRARGYCAAHHRQWLRCGGDTSAMLPLRVTSGAAMVSVSIRLPPPVASAVRGDAAGAREQLVRWADKSKGK